jgi:energy-coupling factor transport system ATP-binding protein
MIAIRNLTVHYGAVAALHDVSLEVPAGQIVLVTGPSGCGKSTLVRVLSGLVPHMLPAKISGTVRVAGCDPEKHTVAELAQQVGTVLQNSATQLFHLEVADDVAFGPRNLGLPEAEVQESVRWALAAVGASGLRNQKTSRLSGGQKQLVALAAALAMRPEVLVLDEPTASLDVAGTLNLVQTLRKLNREQGMTMLIVEHRLAEVYHLAKRVVVLNEGRVVMDSAVEDSLPQSKMWRVLGLRRPAAEPPTAWEKLLQANGPPPIGTQPLLEMEQLAAGYNGTPCIHDITLALYPGEFVALVGDNGAGKSTLALTAAGLMKPTAGKLRFAGGQKSRPGRDVSLLFQNPTDQLFTDSVAEEVAFAPDNFDCLDHRHQEQLLAAADLVGLQARPPLALSLGQQQRTALAACLALKPRLIILDEPTLGQDWGHLQRLMAYLRQLNKQGVTIWLITHDFKLVHRYARRVLYMEHGRITLDGRIREQEETG